MNEISLQYAESASTKKMDGRKKTGSKTKKKDEHKFLFKYNQNFLSINSNLMHTQSFEKMRRKKNGIIFNKNM